MRKIDIKMNRITKDMTTILSYLEKRGMIIKARNGYVWIYNTSPKLEKAIKEGREV